MSGAAYSEEAVFQEGSVTFSLSLARALFLLSPFPSPSPLPFRWRLKYSLLLRLRENGRLSFFRYAIPCVFVSSVLSTDKHFTVGSMGKIWPSQQVGESARESNLTLPKAQEKSSQIMLAQKSSFGQFRFSSPFPFLHSTDEILDLDFSPSFSVLLVI